MYKIIAKHELVHKIKLFEISAPQIARKAQPGQFVILRVNEKGERIPITITNFDEKTGTITLVFHEVGKTTKKLGSLNEGDEILDVVGPLGNPAKIGKYGLVLCVGGGVMVPPLHLQASALRKKGNKIISVVGARTEDILIFEKKMREISDEFYVATDDGSKGYHGLGFLKNILRSQKIDRVITMGSVVMMRTVCEITRPYHLPTVVTLTPIMVDGMGMCGACRVTVGGETKFACVDGPDFDGHQVDWDELMHRQRMYTSEERLSYMAYERLWSVEKR
ncbi:MAG: sulfide/dihydroorotate dehydrogenase-like FAD/NAD-binding protein [Thermoproteota archaeon]|nr:sulfide/dihydroorotate dehydrogenase-like FAD/NAD-binding protein [Thermoproteota archaeon]